MCDNRNTVIQPSCELIENVKPHSGEDFVREPCCCRGTASARQSKTAPNCQCVSEQNCQSGLLIWGKNIADMRYRHNKRHWSFL